MRPVPAVLPDVRAGPAGERVATGPRQPDPCPGGRTHGCCRRRLHTPRSLPFLPPLRGGLSGRRGIRPHTGRRTAPAARCGKTATGADGQSGRLASGPSTPVAATAVPFAASLALAARTPPQQLASTAGKSGTDGVAAATFTVHRTGPHRTVSWLHQPLLCGQRAAGGHRPASDTWPQRHTASSADLLRRTGGACR